MIYLSNNIAITTIMQKNKHIESKFIHTQLFVSKVNKTKVKDP